MQYFFRENKSESKNLLLLIHGNSMDSSHFNFMLEKFESWKIIAPDLYGHGQSPHLKKEEYKIEIFLKQLLDSIQHIAYDKLVIVGHSFGGNLAIECLNYIQPHALLLIASVPLNFNDTRLPYLKVPNFNLSGDQILDSQMLDAALPDFDVTSDNLEFVKQSVLRSDPKFRENLQHEFESGAFQDEVILIKKSNEIKFGLLKAEQDTLVNNNYLTDLSSIFNIIYSIPDAGHFVYLDNPSFCLEKIGDFLKEFEWNG